METKRCRSSGDECAFVWANAGVAQTRSASSAVGRVAIIGGHVEPGETPWPVLCRELKEELGIEGVEGDCLGTLTIVDPADRSSTLHIHSVSKWLGQPAVKNHEHSEIRWFDQDEAPILPIL